MEISAKFLMYMVLKCIVVAIFALFGLKPPFFYLFFVGAPFCWPLFKAPAWKQLQLVLIVLTHKATKATFLQPWSSGLVLGG